MKEKIVVEIDSAMSLCGNCQYKNENGAFCELFKYRIERENNGFKRCAQCLCSRSML